MPGRPRKPTAMLELSGAFEHNPNRARPNEPKDDRDLGDVPGRLPADVVPFWRELVKMSVRGVLRYSDRWAVELAARLMEKAVREVNVPAILELAATAELSSDEIKKLVNPERISSSELATLRSLLSALGLTPADRSKLSVPTEKPKNKFADLAAESSGFAVRPN